jgi:hypothetical protein
VLDIIEFIARAGLALIAAGLAVYMVWKSFNLLQKGIITLQSVAHNDALRIQYKNLIKVQTQIPALAFFVLALICLCIAVWAMPQFKPIGQLKVTAKLQPHPKDIVTAYFDDQNSLAQSEIDTDGVISADILPKVGGVRIKIPAPGYDPPVITKVLSIDKAKGDVLDFGVMAPPTTKVANKPTPNPAQIDPAPK